MKRESFADCSPIFVVGSGLRDDLGSADAKRPFRGRRGGELHFFDQILELRKLVPDLKTAEDIDQLFQSLPSLAGFQYLTDFEPVLADAKRRLLAAHAPGYGLLYRYLLESFCRRQGARRFGEKTTSNLRYLQALLRLFPDCRIIHIVRDPRAAVASRLKVPWASDDVVSNALKWKLEVSCGRSFADEREVGRACFLEIRYASNGVWCKCYGAGWSGRV